ncbi:C6 zinc finger domain-containing [Fusarium albosuccineum]|uniref:C6 zinc finger domain-containing n=1 Tax=Fusarium albosuccineum TaxID=1237068 RepID=A0A8H4P9Z3_9HYPO|nr:C6 zinc finger domain-containing [Fusarium albosuccineum]
MLSGCSSRTTIGSLLGIAPSVSFSPHNKSAQHDEACAVSINYLQAYKYRSVTYRQRNLNTKLEWVKVLQYHFLVTAGLALLAVGLSGLQSADPTANDAKIVKIGAGILTASWVILMIWSLYTLCWAAASKDNPLLIAVIVALVFIGIRVIYTLVALTSNEAKLNPATGSLAIRVVLSFLPELIAVIIFLIAGLFSRNIRDLAKGRPEPAYELRGKA